MARARSVRALTHPPSRPGLDPDTRDYAGNTVAIIACQNGHKNVLKAALRFGAGRDTQNVRFIIGTAAPRLPPPAPPPRAIGCAHLPRN